MENNTKTSVFATLAAIDCNSHTEKKNGLTYLSWAWAWHYVKENYPDATFTIYENAEGRPYFDDGRTCWVKTGVTIQGIEHIEYLPIMDHRNVSIPLERVTSMDMNKAIQRSLTKAAARHGLGLYIYAGEDLPLTDEEARAAEALQPVGTARKAQRTVKKEAPAPDPAPAPASTEASTHDKWVKAIAEGIRTKTGKDPLEAYKEKYNPTEDQLTDLFEDVFHYRIDHNIPANA